jgi:Leucine-rich repeat (LRR) protein
MTILMGDFVIAEVIGYHIHSVSFQNVPNLVNLGVKNTGISHLVIEDLPNLTQCWFGKSMWTDDPSIEVLTLNNLPNLQELNISGSAIREIRGTTPLPELRHITDYWSSLIDWAGPSVPMIKRHSHIPLATWLSHWETLFIRANRVGKTQGLIDFCVDSFIADWDIEGNPIIHPDIVALEELAARYNWILLNKWW